MLSQKYSLGRKTRICCQDCKKSLVFIEIPLTINDKVPFANKQFTVLVPVACKNKDLLCLLALICKPMI